MKLKILSTTVAERRIVKAGEIVDVGENDARILLAYKCAEVYTEPKTPAPEESEPQPDTQPDEISSEGVEGAPEPDAAAKPKPKSKKGKKHE